MGKRNKRWVHEHERDSYVKQARRSEYRSRAVYKLEEIDRKDRILKKDQTVIDLGAAPGSWSQYASRRVGIHGRVIAVDMLPMESINNVNFIHGDFTDQDTLQRCLSCLQGNRVDLVMSDMAPNISGIRSTDQSRAMYLAELVLEFSISILRPGGVMLIKLFQGQGVDQYRNQLVDNFQRVIYRKPGASRDSSREFYVLASGYDV